MASLRILPAVTVAVLFYGVVAVATNAPDFVIQGRVYCDTCRAGFQTNVTEYIKGNNMPFLTSAVEGDTKHISLNNPCNDHLILHFSEVISALADLGSCSS